jgi:replication initiation protein RepC
MPTVVNPGTGLRRFDEHVAFTNKLTEKFCGLPDGKTPSHALATLKRAAPYIGIPIRVTSLIDLLFAWTQPQDWQGGRLPVVWPSNDLLASKLGVTVRQVQKLLKQAQAHRLIAFADSPNGHRGGRRGVDGHIIWSYGIVLAPIGTRIEELASCAARGAAEDAALAVLKKRLAAARRTIRALAQAAMDAGLITLGADNEVALAQMATEHMRGVRDSIKLTVCVMQLEERARNLECLVSAAITTAQEDDNSVNSSCSHEIEDIHSTTTNELKSANADTSNCYPVRRRSTIEVLSSNTQSAVEEDLEKYGVNPTFVAEIAPELCAGLLYRSETWGEVVATAERLVGQSGISAHAFREACRVMGQRGAAVSVITTLQKYQRGEVQRPGAYLRGMSSKAGRGDLNLGRTVHGMRGTSHVAPTRAMANGTEPALIGSLIKRLANRSTAGR